MHRLVDAQPLDIGVVDAATEGARRLSRQLFRIIESLEGHELGAAGRLGPADQIRQRDAAPGQHHGPGLHAAQPVDALLQRALVDEIPYVQGKRLGHLPLYLQSPGLGLEVVAVASRIPLVGTELVEVVVGGGLLLRREDQPLRPGSGMDVERPGSDRRRLVAREEIEHSGLGRKRQGGGAEPQPFQDQTAILIDGFRRDILFGEVVGRAALEQHGKTPGAMRVTIIRPAPAEFYFTENYMN